MQLKVFLSTAITGVMQEEREKIYKDVRILVCNEYEDYYPDDLEKDIIILDNFDEPPAPPDIQYKKLYHLSRALDKMKDCDVFVLLAESDGTIKPGCNVELQAWLSAGGVQPIIRRKSFKYSSV